MATKATPPSAANRVISQPVIGLAKMGAHRQRWKGKTVSKFHRTRLLLLGIAAFAGCSPEAPLTQEAPQVSAEQTKPTSFRVIHASVAEGVAGVFSVDDVSIHFEAKRGPATPVELQELDPDAPAFEIDARILGTSGEPFLVQIGGHSFHDLSWYDVEHSDFPPTSPKRRLQEFMLAELAVAKVRRELGERAEDLSLELEALHALVTAFPADIRFSGEDDTAAAPPDESSGLESLRLPVRSGNNAHWFGIYKKPLSGWMSPFGEHSSTWAIAYSNQGAGLRLSSRITCNHGTCANRAGMTRKCGRAWFNRGRLPRSHNCNTNQANHGNKVGCCTTNYGIRPDNGLHVCHDDTALQRDQLALDSEVVAAPQCRDNRLARNAPSCW